MIPISEVRAVMLDVRDRAKECGCPGVVLEMFDEMAEMDESDLRRAVAVVMDLGVAIWMMDRKRKNEMGLDAPKRRPAPSWN